MKVRRVFTRFFELPRAPRLLNCQYDGLLLIARETGRPARAAVAVAGRPHQTIGHILLHLLEVAAPRVMHASLFARNLDRDWNERGTRRIIHKHAGRQGVGCNGT